MKSAIRIVVLPALLAFAFVATAAWAQQETSATPSTAATKAAAGKTHAQRRADAVEQRISDLHAQLKITEQQAKPWDAFAQTMRDNARKAAMAFHDRSKKLPTMNADEAMKSYAELTQMHADDMQKLASAWSAVYAVLSPAQKQTADAMYRNQGARQHMAPHKHKGTAPASAASSAAAAGG
ncbi:Spy/CpxP family protein refolding chaperone [Rhodanobacter sp. Si-c]|uniref:Spy/CpxP family protein refolding chaperone n=1 Tax=Rhodanobacter lycopersici TaxID=3162487 RepID=A0ABV3QFI0_9GAMM